MEVKHRTDKVETQLVELTNLNPSLFSLVHFHTVFHPDWFFTAVPLHSDLDLSSSDLHSDCSFATCIMRFSKGARQTTDQFHSMTDCKHTRVCNPL